MHEQERKNTCVPVKYNLKKRFILLIQSKVAEKLVFHIFINPFEHNKWSELQVGNVLFYR